MNVFIFTDLEGISGVTNIDFMDKDNPKYSLACQLLCKSINSAVSACIDAGADKIYYIDGHAGGGNICEEAIDKRALKCSLSEWQTLLENGGIDCQIELGSHARAGTIGGFLDHTVSSKSWFCHKINGIEMSELSLHALVCGAYGIPTVACIGDEAACEQAKEYIPDIYRGAVKKATCRNFAENYDNADNILTDTIKTALNNYKNVSIYKIDEPATVSLTFCRTDMCEKAYARCTDEVTRVDARTLCRTVDKITRYGDLKF
ncbi:MAG: M55 family metallopeptidase [Clostridia bacterium]|nr:M55 family metallopeptidase [Clostridia bacterium]